MSRVNFFGLVLLGILVPGLIMGQDTGELGLRSDTPPEPPEPSEIEFDQMSDELRQFLKEEFPEESVEPEVPDEPEEATVSGPQGPEFEGPEADTSEQSTDSVPDGSDTEAESPAEPPAPEEVEAQQRPNQPEETNQTDTQPSRLDEESSDQDQSDTGRASPPADLDPEVDLDVGSVVTPSMSIPDEPVSVASDETTVLDRSQPRQISPDRPAETTRESEGARQGQSVDWTLVLLLWATGLIGIGWVHIWTNRREVQVVDRMPRSPAKNSSSSTTDDGSRGPGVTSSPKGPSEQQQALGQVLQELDLGEEFREALRLYLFENCSQEEILRRSGLNRRQLKTLLHRIQRQL